MALVTCPDCGKQVSDTAKMCINCGRVLKDQTVTIEKTGKRIKLAMLVSVAALILGAMISVFDMDIITPMVLRGMEAGYDMNWLFYAGMYVPSALMTAGTVGLAGAAALKWWKHE